MWRFSPRPNRAHLVNWRQWGEAAFQEAQQQNKLVVLWLTAFWCGYCQRMDETTLSNSDVHALLNAFFVPIRVEESQRPDIDVRYNQNGWPTIAFLTPAGDDLLRVNYLAPDPFISLLVKLVDAHQRDPAALFESAARQRLDAQQRKATPEPVSLGPPLVGEIAGLIEGLADQVHGGYGTQAKFLHPEANTFFLYLFGATGDRSYIDHVALTLTTMRQSRTFDHQDGGFFRYASRPDWGEPHPEKLLEDQAGLLRNYLHTYLVTDQETYKETAEGLVDYLNSTLTDAAQPCFWGCQDYVRPEVSAADSRSGPPPLLSLIDTYVYCDANAKAASAYLDAWWILGRDDCRHRAEAILEHLWDTLRTSSGDMYHYWDGEPHGPGLLMDITWMGLALLDAYAVLGQPIYLERAVQLGEVMVQQYRNPSGGFFDISATGPASLQVPITLLTQNAHVAAFFVRLADLSGTMAYRKLAYWALRHVDQSHHHYAAFAAGFGHALAQLLTLPLILTITGVAGEPGVRALARRGLTGLRHGDVVLKFQSRPDRQTAGATIQVGEKRLEAITDPAMLGPELIVELQK